MVAIELNDDEALVLFELLARAERSGVLALEHPAEERSLECVQACLARALVAPFQPNYADLLAPARVDVCARWGGG